MKKFKQMIIEAGEQATFGKYAVGYTPSVLKKINAIIGSYVIEDQIDPYAAINRIRGSLSNLGLTFDKIEDFTESSGNLSLPLSAFGGRFGKDIDTPHDEFLNDDGLSHIIEGGLSLHISYDTTDTNQCRLRAHIE
jgi:hypothetical protein|tara:strand:+ start:150 stop:557 length:408 start_codon:yes stop_codon:yes gene_type:complete